MLHDENKKFEKTTVYKKINNSKNTILLKVKTHTKVKQTTNESYDSFNIEVISLDYKLTETILTELVEKFELRLAYEYVKDAETINSSFSSSDEIL